VNDDVEAKLLGFLRVLAARCKVCFRVNTHMCRTCDSESAKALLRLVNDPSLTGATPGGRTHGDAEARRREIMRQLEVCGEPMRGQDFLRTDGCKMETLQMMLLKMVRDDVIKRRKIGRHHYYAMSEKVLDNLL
jgi:hypothetical protein